MKEPKRIANTQTRPTIRKKQTRAEYFAGLDKAIDNLENRRNLVSFTVEEFEQAFPQTSRPT